MTNHCRICLEETGTLVYPCLCKGSTGGMHRKCLERWVRESNSEVCEICHEAYSKREQCGVNCSLWFNNCCTLRPSSIIERALIACAGPHLFFGGMMLFMTPIDNYVFVSSMKTLAMLVSLVLIQIYHSDAPLFFYKVGMVWQFIYLILFCIVGAIRADTMIDSCDDQCYKVARVYCNEECPIAMYYQKKTKKIDQTCLLELLTFLAIVIFKIVVDCCVNMKVVRYYNRNDTFMVPNSSEEEGESLLLDSSGIKGSSSSSSFGSSSGASLGDIEV